MEYVVLPSGCKMPVVGLGTFQVTNEEELETALNEALKVGYRHIDTAYLYTNEKIIGKVLKEWLDSGRVKREELFIVTKLPSIGMRSDLVPYFLQKSLQALQLDYVDLYLIHSPMGLQYVNDDDLAPTKDGEFLFDMTTDLEAVWKAMEGQVDKGLAKSIGLSNFDEDQVEKLAKMARLPISNNQVEMQVFSQQKALREVCKKYNVPLCAYGPLGSPGREALFAKRGMKFEDPGILKNPTVTSIAEAHGKSAAQILIRFLVQEGMIVIPKSTNPERIRTNFEVFDFALSEAEMEQLRALDKGDAGRTFTFLSFKGIDKHPECPKWVIRLKYMKNV